MWALAMALSSQFDSSRELLYNETRQMLEELDLTEDDTHSLRIEQVQAWLLVAYYEFARSNYRRASISAGRAFRLVQLARLHEVDSAENDEDPVVTEERRRTFWVAYCLDRLISMRGCWPLTLIEEVVSCLSLSFVTRYGLADYRYYIDRYVPGYPLRNWLFKGAILCRDVSCPRRSPRVTTTSYHHLPSWPFW